MFKFSNIISLASTLIVALLVSSAQAGELEEGIKALQSNQLTEAAAHFQLAANAGNPMAEYNLGLMYSRGAGVPADPSKAVMLYRLAAEKGFVQAQANLGLMLTLGKGVQSDDIEADMWYLIAAHGGDKTAQKNSETLQERMSTNEIKAAHEKEKQWLNSHTTNP